MRKFCAIVALTAAATLGAGCATGYTAGSAGGDVIAPADAAQTVVLHVNNHNPNSLELRAIVNGRSEFLGSVGGNDSTNVLLDSTWFPSGDFRVIAIPADGRGRAVSGPLAASKGDRINFLVMPALDQSHAVVVR